jgi:plastocyanin domain-containing protein
VSRFIYKKKKTKKKLKQNPNKQNKIYPKINIDKGYLPSSIYIDRGGNIGLYKF